MNQTDKPRAKSDMKCPLWKKPMKQVCHTCEWWTHLRGKHPQGEETIDSWGCAIAWLPLLLVENSQRQLQTAASVDKVATVMQTTGDEATALRAELISKVVRASFGPSREQLNNESDHPRLR
ncbi:MAG TPA: hypothetical protein VIZ32_16585 [Vicinamibacterales bacterium]